MEGFKGQNIEEGLMARLTEQEQQEIIRYIDANKPLPDKFRFLLFEDKREVELVWNGKTSEVCNIVLPFQVIEQVDEPRAEKPEHTALQGDLFTTDARGRQLKGWTKKGWKRAGCPSRPASGQVVVRPHRSEFWQFA
jgi:hypothetical protein